MNNKGSLASVVMRVAGAEGVRPGRSTSVCPPSLQYPILATTPFSRTCLMGFGDGFVLALSDGAPSRSHGPSQRSSNLMSRVAGPAPAYQRLVSG